MTADLIEELIEPLLIWDLETAKTRHCNSIHLIDAISKILNINDCIIDFGCGTGFYLKYLQKQGFNNLIGLEGTADIEQISYFKPIQNQDLSINFNLNTKGNIICLEVIEHLLKEQEDIIIDNILTHLQGYLILSWAVKGQGGDGHNNCQNNLYVYNKFIEKGLEFCPKETFYLRDSIKIKCSWFKNTILVFKTKRNLVVPFNK